MISSCLNGNQAMPGALLHSLKIQIRQTGNTLASFFWFHAASCSCAFASWRLPLNSWQSILGQNRNFLKLGMLRLNEFRTEKWDTCPALNFEPSTSNGERPPPERSCTPTNG